MAITLRDNRVLNLFSTCFAILILTSAKSQSFVEIGLGLPIQQFEHSGGVGAGTNGLGLALDLGYLYRWRQWSMNVTIQYVNTSDVFLDIDNLTGPNYTGKIGLLRFNPNLGYQFLVPLNRKKSRKIAIEPFLGVAKDVLLHAKYESNGLEIAYRAQNHFSLFPTYGFRLGYSLTKRYMINLRTVFSHTIEWGNYQYYPSIYLFQPDVVVNTFFSTTSISLIIKL